MGTKVARLSRFLGVAVAAVALAGVLVPGAAPSAMAYDQGSCGYPRSYYDIDKPNTDTGTSGKVDFGDDWHVNGVPQGDAIICWETGRRSVSMIGKLYYDSWDAGCADIDVAVYDTAGGIMSYQTYSEVCSDWGLKSRVVEHSVFASGVNKVRIRLYSREYAHERRLVTTVTRYYGD